MSFLTEAAARRLATVSVPRTAAITAQRATFATSIRFQKAVTDTAKDGLKSVDRAVSDKLVDGIEIGATVGTKIKEAGEEIIGGKATGKAAELRGEASGKSSELAGQAKGKANEMAGKVKGKADEISKSL